MRRSRSGGNKVIATHFRCANIALFAAFTVLIAFILAFTLNKKVKSVSQDYARFYSSQTIGVLNSHLNHEVSMIWCAAHTRGIAGWLADENDPGKKAVALESMISIINTLYSDNIVIGVESSLHEYAVVTESAASSLLPSATLDPALPADAWYFETIAAPGDYTLNLDRDEISLQPQAWLNCKVSDGDRLAGVLRVRLKLDQYIEAAFKEHAGAGVRNLIVDGFGAVQIDIGQQQRNASGNIVTVANGSDNIVNYCSDEAFQSALRSHMESMDGYFGPASEPVVVEISTRPYSFAAITPLEASDWTVVTFYDSTALFEWKDLWPPLIIIPALLLIYIALFNMLNHKLIFMPLNGIMRSLIRMGENGDEPIFGAEREDEFGVLARTIQDMTDRLDAHSANLQQDVEARAGQIMQLYKQISVNERRLDRIVSNIHIALATFDRDLKLINCNHFCRALFKARDKRQLADAFLNDRQALLGDGSFDRVFAEAREQRHSSSEVEFKDLEGNTFWADFNIDWIPDTMKPDDGVYEVYIVDIQNKKEVEFSLMEKANTDKLTGIYNRACFDNLLIQKVAKAERSSSAISLIFFDIDHFKRVNDTFGHDIGDLTLKTICDTVSRGIRKTDTFARWGGEEFVVLTQDTPLDVAYVLAEKLRKRIESTEFPFVGQVTASFGVAQRETDEPHSEWFKRADQALLQAKAAGRNRVVGS